MVNSATRDSVPPPVSSKSALALIGGYLGLVVGTLAARRAPVTEYEASIYTGTPGLFWIVVVATVIIATVLSIWSNSRITQGLALSLGGVAILTTVSLPAIRGYHYLGEVDAMTHLGTARDVAAGVLDPQDILYPAIHLIGVTIAFSTGLDLELAMFIVVPTFVAAFLLFVPLTVRALTADFRAVAIAGLTAMCLLPINWIAVILQPHPSSQAILFFPVLAGATAITLRHPRVASSLVLLVVFGTVAIIHPMHAVNVVAMVGIVAVAVLVPLQTVAGPSGGRRIAALAIAIVLGIGLFLWIGVAASDSLVRFARTFRVALTEGTPAEAMVHQLDALATVGANTFELFIKLFLVSFLFCLAAGITILRAVTSHWPPSKNHHNLLATATGYAAVGFLPLVVLFFVYFLAGIEPFEFRQLGFAMAVVTFLGAISVYRFDRVLAHHIRRPATDTITSLIFIIVILASVPVIYSSPFIYLPMGHVPEAQVSGYDTALEIRDQPVPIAYVRSDPARYSDAIHGVSAFERYDFYGGELDRNVPNHFADRDLAGHYDRRHYLAVTAADRERDPYVYGGLRYTTEDFEYLEEDARIDRVHTNGAFDFYLIRSIPSG